MTTHRWVMHFRVQAGNLFKTNLLCLAHMSAKATDTLRRDVTGNAPQPPPPREVKALVKRVKSLYDGMRDWLPED